MMSDTPKILAGSVYADGGLELAQFLDQVALAAEDCAVARASGERHGRTAEASGRMRQAYVGALALLQDKVASAATPTKQTNLRATLDDELRAMRHFAGVVGTIISVRELLRHWVDRITAATQAAADRDDDGYHEVGRVEGYQAAVSDVAAALGLNEEYRASPDPDRDQRDPASMIKRIREYVGRLKLDGEVTRSTFISGYLDTRYRSGDRPDTSEPASSGLPAVPPGYDMQVKTCLAPAGEPLTSIPSEPQRFSFDSASRQDQTSAALVQDGRVLALGDSLEDLERQELIRLRASMAELTRVDGSPQNVRSAEVLAARVRNFAHYALDPSANHPALTDAPPQLRLPTRLAYLSRGATRGRWRVGDRTVDRAKLDAAGSPDLGLAGCNIPWAGLAEVITHCTDPSDKSGLANADLIVEAVNFVRDIEAAQDERTAKL